MEDEINIKDEIAEGRSKHGFVKVIPCSHKENEQYEKMVEAGEKLPDGVKPYTYYDGSATGEYFTVHKEEITDSEKMEYLAYKQLSMMATIRNLIIGLLVLGFILLIVSFSILSKTNVIFDYVESVKEAVSDFTYDLNSFFRSISRW